MVTTNTNSLSRLDVENEISADKVVNNTASNNEEQSEFELSDSDLQLQVKRINPIIFITKCFKTYARNCIFTITLLFI
jgi:hypothetical protein